MVLQGTTRYIVHMRGFSVFTIWNADVRIADITINVILQFTPK